MDDDGAGVPQAEPEMPPEDPPMDGPADLQDDGPGQQQQ